MGLTDEQKEEYTECFKLFDKDEDGKIDASELVSVVRALGLNPSEPQAEEMVKKVAPKGGLIGPEAVHKVMDGHGIVNDSEDAIVAAFKIFDNQGNGKIMASELKGIYSSMGEAFNEEEVAQLDNILDPDDKGLVDYAEFTKKLLSA